MIGSCNRIKLFFVCFINYVLWLYSFCTIYVLRASVLVRKLGFCNAITMKYLSSLNSCFKSLDITLSLLAQYFATLQCNPALACVPATVRRPGRLVVGCPMLSCTDRLERKLCGFALFEYACTCMHARPRIHVARHF